MIGHLVARAKAEKARTLAYRHTRSVFVMEPFDNFLEHQQQRVRLMLAEFEERRCERLADPFIHEMDTLDLEVRR